MSEKFQNNISYALVFVANIFLSVLSFSGFDYKKDDYWWDKYNAAVIEF